VSYSVGEGKMLEMFMDERSIEKWVSLLNRHCQAYINRNLKEYNIGRGQYIFILALYKHAGINQDKLSELLSIDKCTTAKAIKRLEAEGYVRREIDDEDRRAYKLYATEKAFQIKPVICNIMKQVSDILALDLTEEERETSLQLIQKISRSAVFYLR
jgi:DNA-binding MarR family transcriptional regulator